MGLGLKDWAVAHRALSSRTVVGLGFRSLGFRVKGFNNLSRYSTRYLYMDLSTYSAKGRGRKVFND